MRDRVHAAGAGDPRGQRAQQVGIVDHRLRQHARIAPGLLLALRGDPVDRRHLRARKGGGDGEDRQLGGRARWPCPARWSSPRRWPRSNRHPISLPPARAASAVSIGTCITAWSYTPAERLPRRADTSSAEARCSGVDSTSARVAPRRSISSPSRSSAPTPNTTRDGCPLKTKGFTPTSRMRCGNGRSIALRGPPRQWLMRPPPPEPASAARRSASPARRSSSRRPSPAPPGRRALPRSPPGRCRCGSRTPTPVSG